MLERSDSTSSNAENNNNNESHANREDIKEIKAKYAIKGKAHLKALDAQKARVSRRLLLSERSKQLTLVSPENGIVCLLDVPRVPGFALIYSHPLENLSNCRLVAQRGASYLWNLDTQILAGILITLAADYELFAFQPYDSGAQKNAILRTCGKELLIDAILLIEEKVHSRNELYIPRLSFLVEGNFDGFNAGQKLHNWIKLVVKTLDEPLDTSVYDEDEAPKKVGTSVTYLKDVLRAEKIAKKELLEDTKRAKEIAVTLVKENIFKPAFKSFIANIFGDKGENLLLIDNSEGIEMLINQKLIVSNHPAAQELVKILRKDRKALGAERSEDFGLENDDPKPGQEDAIPESLEHSDDGSPSDLSISNSDSPTDSPSQDAQNAPAQGSETRPEIESAPPEVMSLVDKIIWKKRMAAAAQAAKRNQEASQVQATYIPSARKDSLGKDEK